MRFSQVIAGLTLLSAATALWPEPTKQTNGTQVLYLDPSSVQTTYKPLASSSGASNSTVDAQLISGAFTRFKTNVGKAAYVPWKFYPRGDSFEPAHNSSGASLKSIVVQQTLPMSKTRSNSSTPDEQYTLDVFCNGTALIQASTANGAMHGLTSLLQLFYKSTTNQIYTNLAPVHIEDKPVYEYRGLNMDIARNWEPPSSVKHLIDGMELAKFNVLHIHATDAQSWPIDIPSMPELAQKGAYAPHLYWTASELDDVLSYAYARGIEPIIEIDSPGHLSSVAYSHPDLIAAFNVQPWGNDCAEPPCGSIQLNNPDVYKFFDKLYSDLLPRTSKYSKRFHSGGDEVNANAYLLDPTVKSNDSAVLQPLIQKFKSHLEATINKAGLQNMVWEEMIVNWNLTLNPNTIVQTWQGQDSIADVAGKGYKTLFGDYYHWYMDCGYGQWLDPNTTAIADGTGVIKPPYTDYCNPLKSWREMYSYDPTVNLTAAMIENLYGGEVHIWHELTDATNLDSKVWPRALAGSEIMWSGIKGVAGVDEGVTRRMSDMRERLVALGFGANPVTMTWCLQNLGDCTL